MNEDLKKYLTIATFIIIPGIGGGLGGIVTSSQIKPWYEKIERPTWTPPNWVFGPVWTTLYLLLGISSYLIYKSDQEIATQEIETQNTEESHCTSFGPKKETDRKDSLILFAVNIFLNWIWTPIFFGLHQVAVAFFVIIALDAVVLYMMMLFFRIKKIAGFMIIPYMTWLTLATCLNISVWSLNGAVPVANMTMGVNSTRLL